MLRTSQPNEFNHDVDSVDHARVFETEVELLTIGKVTSVIERQLSDVNKDIETSVVGISKGFQGMATRAQAAVSAASGSGEEQAAGNEGRIDEVKAVVGNLVQHMGESFASIKNASDRLHEVEERLNNVGSVLKDIEKIASQSRLVALNGQIEASRLGSQGAAFAVVASETKQLSQHAAETSGKIRQLLTEMTQVIVATSLELAERLRSDESRLATSKDEADSLLHYIEGNHLRMTASLKNTGQISRELQSDISRAVMSLQFQDRVSQRLEHVIATLKTLNERVDAAGNAEYDSLAEQRSQTILSEMARGFTMESERIAMSGATTTDDKPADDFDVELF